MAEIKAAAVMALRNRTGVSMMECKKALVEAEGNEEAAIEILRKKGAAKAAKKADRETAEGTIAIEKNAAVKVLCETDFVARNEDFVSFVEEIAKITASEGLESGKAFFEANKSEKMTQLGENLVLDQIELLEGDVFGGYVHSNKKLATVIALVGGGDESLASDIAMHATATNPAVIDPSEVSDELIEQEKGIWRDQLIQEGKPENIIENIMKGKEAKFRNEGALLEQEFVKNPEMKIKDMLSKAGSSVKTCLRVEI